MISTVSARLPTVLQLLKLPDGTVKVLVEGGARAEIKELLDRGEHFSALIEEIVENEMLTSRIRCAGCYVDEAIRGVCDAQQENSERSD